MADDLKQRLREVTEDDAYAQPWTFGATCREAADRIEALEVEISSLQAEVVRMDGAVSTHKVAHAAEVAHGDRLAESLARIAYQSVHRDTFPRVAMRAIAAHYARRSQ